MLGIIISRKGQLSLLPVVHTFQRHKLLSMLKKFLTASSSRPRFKTFRILNSPRREKGKIGRIEMSSLGAIF